MYLMLPNYLVSSMQPSLHPPTFLIPPAWLTKCPSVPPSCSLSPPYHRRPGPRALHSRPPYQRRRLGYQGQFNAASLDIDPCHPEVPSCTLSHRALDPSSAPWVLLSRSTIHDVVFTAAFIPHEHLHYHDLPDCDCRYRCNSVGGNDKPSRRYKRDRELRYLA